MDCMLGAGDTKVTENAVPALKKCSIIYGLWSYETN